MLKKLVFFSICAFLCISADAVGKGGTAEGETGPSGTDVHPRLSAALCEMAAWEASGRADRDSLLLAKAECLDAAGLYGEAYHTVCRIQAFGLSEEEVTDLLRRKLLYSWSAGMMDEFRALLDEAADSPLAGTLASVRLSRKPRHRSEDAAMLLSVIPGVGLAYAGDWSNAAEYFLYGAETMALGAGAFASKLYVSTFLGGGMLLYTILPRSTDMAVKAAEDFNQKALKEYYAPVYEALRSGTTL